MYIALYRKYRPKIFEDVVSQNHITTTLQNEIKLKKIAHAYLFSGPKGTGKTTCARIFSKAINCKNPKDGNPCCECEVCKNLESESVVDVTEIDGASNNGVNDVRIIREEANFVPTYCKYRIYIIDEAHMLSSSAFNALLKIMEDPPKHVVFILATTEVEKFPQTIVSRCQRFDFNRININDIELNIKKIAEKEKIKITEKACKKIALISQGSMRDAISILDRCSVLCSEIDIENLNEILGILDEDYILKIHDAFINTKEAKLIKIVNEIYCLGKNLDDFVLELIEFYREMLYFNLFKDETEEVLEYFKYCEIIKKIECFSNEVLNLILEELLNCYEKVKFSSNKKLLIDMFILKIFKTVIKDSKNVENSIEKLKENENLAKTSEKTYKEKTKKEIENVDEHKKEKEIEINKSENINKKTLSEKSENISNENFKTKFEKLIEFAKNNNIEVEEE